MIAMSGSLQQPQYASHRRGRSGVDARKLWSGGAASAVVTGLLALTGVLISRWLFDLPVLAPKGNGTYGDVHTTAFVLAAAGGALLATGLVHLLMLAVPRPLLYFGWIIALVTIGFQLADPLYRTGLPVQHLRSAGRKDRHRDRRPGHWRGHGRARGRGRVPVQAVAPLSLTTGDPVA